MTSWKGKSRGGITGYRIFVLLLKYTGMIPAYLLLVFVAFYYYLFSGQSFRNTFVLYRHRLKFGPIQAAVAVYRNFYVFGQILLDRTAFMAGFANRFSFTFEGEQHLHQMVSDNSGGILISAHLGNFEIAGQLLERLDTKINIIMHDAEHEKIKEYLQSITTRSFHVIRLQEDGAHIYEIKEAIEKKEIVCIHGDRFMPGNKTIRHRFLGQDAAFPAGPFHLALRQNTPLSFVFAMKESWRHYHFYASRPKTYPLVSGLKEREDIMQRMIGDYVMEMENILHRYPFQWFNYYNFWNDEIS